MVQYKIGNTFAESLIEMGRHREAVVDATAALSTAEREGDRALAAGALLALGRSENDLGRSERARTLLTRARRAFRDERDVRGEAWTLHRLSETWSGVDYGRELRDLRLAYGLFSRARDRAGRSVTAQDLAYLLSLKGDAEFRSWYARSRRLTEDEGDLRSRAALARTTGYHAYYRGRSVAAMTAMDEARPLAARCGDRYAEADAVFIRALAASAVGSPATVEASVQELLRFASELGSTRLRVLALLVGARASLRAGRSGEASRRLATAVRLVETRRMTIVGVEADATRAWLALDRGDFSSVAPAAGRAAAAARRNGWDLWSSIGPLLRGRALLGAGRPARAARELDRAAQLARTSGADGTERLARLLLGQCLILLGRPSPAVRPIEDDPEHRALAHELAAARHLGRGRPQAALAELGDAVARWRSMGLTSWLARAMALRAASARDAGELSLARSLDAEARDVLRTIRTPRDERSALLAPI